MYRVKTGSFEGSPGGMELFGHGNCDRNLAAETVMMPADRPDSIVAGASRTTWKA